MQSTWRVYLVSALLACVVAAVTALVTVRLLVSPTVQSPTVQSSNTMILEGVVDLARGAEREVFYKTPFAAPPSLTFPEGLEQWVQVTDQKAGSFKLQRGPNFGPDVAKVKWKAEGQPVK
jgi:hypothetical protein